jgi:hypothetical protein
MEQEGRTQANSLEASSGGRGEHAEQTERDVHPEEPRLRQETVELQRDELRGDKHDGQEKKIISLSPGTATLLAAVFGVLGTGAGALTQGWFNRQLEHDRFTFNKEIEQAKFNFSKDLESQKNESNLILKAIDTGDPDKARRNILFLVQAGYIKDPTGNIVKIASDPQTVPLLASNSEARASSSPAQRTASVSQVVNSENPSYEIADGEVTINISVGYAVHADYTIKLYDHEGKNPIKIGIGTNSDAVPDEFKVGVGKELAGKVLFIQVRVSSPSGSTTPVSISYRLRGGKAEQTFATQGSLSNGAGIFSQQIRFIG